MLKWEANHKKKIERAQKGVLRKIKEKKYTWGSAITGLTVGLDNNG